MSADFPGFTETHRSFVNTWECDENRHMNVQFYIRRFSEAAQIFAAIHDNNAQPEDSATIRQIRYLRELPSNTSFTIYSGLLSAENGAQQIGHVLINQSDSEVSAFCLDLNPHAVTAPMADIKSVRDLMPRGIEFQKKIPMPGPEFLKSPMATATGYFATNPGECDRFGNLRSQMYVAGFTDAAPQIWNHIGLTSEWLEERNFGRVAVELQLQIHRPLTSGTTARLISRAHLERGKLIRVMHQIMSIDMNTCYATGEVVGLIMDLNTRKSVALPDILKA